MKNVSGPAVKTLAENKELSPMHTPQKACEDDSDNDNEKWRLGAYSSSKSNLTNSDDKKMSDWSKKLLEDSLHKEQKFVVLGSPVQEKRHASPKTPENRMWKQQVVRNENDIMPELRSKSMNKQIPNEVLNVGHALNFMNYAK
jgi:hypothetical protein